MQFVWGAVGFFGFEGLRVYKKIIAGEDAIPSRHTTLYAVTVVWICVFAGIVAFLMQLPSAAHALYVGFSVPSIMKALVGTRAGGVEVDDVEIRDEATTGPAGPATLRGYWAWVVTFLSY